LLSGGDGGRPLDLTPSPSDSGVVELEVALRERDSELAYLRQTMEHNEQVIFRVYQEKERLWERELRRMKNVHENRLRAAAQKSLKLEQMLMMQTYQVNLCYFVVAFGYFSTRVFFFFGSSAITDSICFNERPCSSLLLFTPQPVSRCNGRLALFHKTISKKKKKTFNKFLA
jgi:hypothetical protein